MVVIIKCIIIIICVYSVANSSTVEFHNFGKDLFQVINILDTFSTVTVCQNLLISSISLSLFLGLMTHWLYSFNLCHKFSIGLQSGDPAGVLHQFTLFAVKKSLACLDECLGSLSTMNLWLVGYTSLIKDSNVFRSISVYSNTSMIPSKMQIPVGPLLLIPPQTSNLMGCFALYKMKHFYVNT